MGREWFVVSPMAHSPASHKKSGQISTRTESFPMGADLMSGVLELDTLTGSAAHLLLVTRHTAAESVRQKCR
jgi:hypothetical protein